MANLACPVDRCDRTRRGDQNICGACEDQLRRDLAWIPELAEELDITLSRQAVIGAGGGGGDKPLPFSVAASDAGALLRDTLAGWVAVLHSEDEEAVETSLASAAVWLLDRHARIIRHPAVVDLVEEVAAVVACASRVVDRPGERQYAGPCPGPECGTDLYAHVKAVMVRCRECGESWRVEERRDVLLGEVRDRLARASECAHILTSLLGSGVVLEPRTVRNWALRGRIVAHGQDGQKHPLYKVSECEVLFVAELERRARRDAKAAS